MRSANLSSMIWLRWARSFILTSGNSVRLEFTVSLRIERSKWRAPRNAEASGMVEKWANTFWSKKSTAHLKMNYTFESVSHFLGLALIIWKLSFCYYFCQCDPLAIFIFILAQVIWNIDFWVRKAMLDTRKVMTGSFSKLPCFIKYNIYREDIVSEFSSVTSFIKPWLNKWFAV